MHFLTSYLGENLIISKFSSSLQQVTLVSDDQTILLKENQVRCVALGATSFVAVFPDDRDDRALVSVYELNGTPLQCTKTRSFHVSFVPTGASFAPDDSVLAICSAQFLSAYHLAPGKAEKMLLFEHVSLKPTPAIVVDWPLIGAVVIGNEGSHVIKLWAAEARELASTAGDEEEEEEETEKFDFVLKDRCSFLGNADQLWMLKQGKVLASMNSDLSLFSFFHIEKKQVSRFKGQLNVHPSNCMLTIDDVSVIILPAPERGVIRFLELSSGQAVKTIKYVESSASRVVGSMRTESDSGQPEFRSPLLSHRPSLLSAEKLRHSALLHAVYVRGDKLVTIDTHCMVVEHALPQLKVELALTISNSLERMIGLLQENVMLLYTPDRGLLRFVKDGHVQRTLSRVIAAVVPDGRVGRLPHHVAVVRWRRYTRSGHMERERFLEAAVFGKDGARIHHATLEMSDSTYSGLLDRNWEASTLLAADFFDAIVFRMAIVMDGIIWMADFGDCVTVCVPPLRHGPLSGAQKLLWVHRKPECVVGFRCGSTCLYKLPPNLPRVPMVGQKWESPIPCDDVEAMCLTPDGFMIVVQAEMCHIGMSFHCEMPLPDKRVMRRQLASSCLTDINAPVSSKESRNWDTEASLDCFVPFGTAAEESVHQIRALKDIWVFGVSSECDGWNPSCAISPPLSLAGDAVLVAIVHTNKSESVYWLAIWKVLLNKIGSPGLLDCQVCQPFKHRPRVRWFGSFLGVLTLQTVRIYQTHSLSSNSSSMRASLGVAEGDVAPLGVESLLPSVVLVHRPTGNMPIHCLAQSEARAVHLEAVARAMPELCLSVNAAKQLPAEVAALANCPSNVHLLSEACVDLAHQQRHVFWPLPWLKAVDTMFSIPHFHDNGKMLLAALTGNKIRANSSLLRLVLRMKPRTIGSSAPLIDAVFQSNKDVIQAAIALSSQESLHLEGLTILHEAAALGNAALVNVLVSTQPELLKVEDDWGRLPLHYAAAHGHHDVVRVFLTRMKSIVDGDDEYGELIDTLDSEGANALSLAVQFGHIECIRLLVRAGADPLVYGPIGVTKIGEETVEGISAFDIGLCRLACARQASLSSTSTEEDENWLGLERSSLACLEESKTVRKHRHGLAFVSGLKMGMYYAGFLVLVTLFALWETTQWNSVQLLALRTAVTDVASGTGTDYPFNQINSIDSCWEFLEEAFLPSIWSLGSVRFPVTNDMVNAHSFTGLSYGSMFHSNVLVGAVQLRQVRSEYGACGSDIPPEFAPYFPSCVDPPELSSPLDGVVKEGGDFGSWSHLGWFSYSDGGQVARIPAGNMTRAKEVFSLLKENTWISDRTTRALFIDFAVFNGVLNQVVAVQMLVEIPLSGGIYTHVSSAIIDWSPWGFLKFVFLFLQYTLFIAPMVFLYSEAKELMSIGQVNIRTLKTYFRTDWWNVWDIANALILMAYSVLMTTASFEKDTIEISSNDDGDSNYVNFQMLAYLTSKGQDFLALCVLLSYLKIFKYMKELPGIGPVVRAITSTILHFKTVLFLFTLVIVVWAIVVSVHCAFGTNLIQYRTLSESFFSALHLTIHDSLTYHVSQLQLPNFAVGSAIYLIGVLLTGVVAINILVAVLCDVYGEELASSNQRWDERLDDTLSTAAIREANSSDADRQERLARLRRKRQNPLLEGLSSPCLLPLYDPLAPPKPNVDQLDEYSNSVEKFVGNSAEMAARNIHRRLDLLQNRIVDSIDASSQMKLALLEIQDLVKANIVPISEKKQRRGSVIVRSSPVQEEEEEEAFVFVEEKKEAPVVPEDRMMMLYARSGSLDRASGGRTRSVDALYSELKSASLINARVPALSPLPESEAEEEEEEGAA